VLQHAIRGVRQALGDDLMADRHEEVENRLLTSRTDPPLGLARLRVSGQLAEVRERDLRFTPQEATELLRTAVGPDLPEAAVAVLEDRTEGWVAGLQLAALSLRGHADPAGFVATFSGSHRYVLDYLAEEVLDRQPQPLRAFLLETSILERLSGPLCAAVTGRSDSQARLDSLPGEARPMLKPVGQKGTARSAASSTSLVSISTPEDGFWPAGHLHTKASGPGGGRPHSQ
jgi:hypothetical protein